MGVCGVLTDALAAFFAAVTGGAPSSPALVLFGCALTVAPLLLVFLLAALLSRRLRMPLPPEEREGETKMNEASVAESGIEAVPDAEMRGDDVSPDAAPPRDGEDV